EEMMYQCVVWGDPHVTRFPSNETESPSEVWCQEDGLLWLVKNKYIYATNWVSHYPYIVLDVSQISAKNSEPLV
ncbi:unnamed protein product, partial [Didymodactylos carnosus]